MFISLEGVDGSGKSTQAHLLAQNLRAAGMDVLLTREPGGSPGAEEIRNLLITGSTDRWSAQTEILLFAAARRDHLEKTVLPAIDAGKVVITDRFADSTRVYQGVSDPEMRRIYDRIHDLVIPTDPDLTFILDIDPERALGRAIHRIQCEDSDEDRFEERGLGFQRSLRAGFIAIAEAEPERCRLIDADVDPGDLAERLHTETEMAMRGMVAPADP